ncbi:MAG: RNA polymerase sigma factor [Planctomycetota bacterium]|jgi:RNA polymerase sigma-70 factor (ECF subfamily)
MSPPKPKEPLEKTLQRAAGGDEAAWQRIVEAYGPRVFGLIRAQCGNAELAEEISQSTFCTIVARIGQYTELGRFESWLFRIAMNRLRDEMRRRKRHAHPQDEVQALRAAMDRLSEADRRVIHLRHFAGLSFARIAEVLGEPLGTVLARQHRALGKLRQMLAEGAE